MRKHISKPNKPEKAVFSVKKILIISVICFIVTGMIGVMASNSRVKNVKIILSSGYEMDVVTTSDKVSDILKENNIDLLDDESATPNIDANLSSDKTITIKKGKKEPVSPESYFSEQDILKSYQEVVEKVVKVQEEIPFETVTKDVSNGSDNKQDKVVQAGSNGLKEITYKIKYQNGQEISKDVIKEEVIQEPVDKIVEVRTKVTSRSSGSRVPAASGSVAEYQAYAAARCKDYGWSEADFGALVSLWNRESGWRVNASNPSGAYGIPQALPGKKMGAGWQTDYKAQINWGLNYIKGRYGSPSRALSHSNSTGWY